MAQMHACMIFVAERAEKISYGNEGIISVFFRYDSRRFPSSPQKWKMTVPFGSANELISVPSVSSIA